MKKIGITGGVGSGKSLVLAYLKEQYQAKVYQADLIAHEMQKPGTDCYQKICERFGEDILEQDGTINRKKLGQIVFQDEKALEELNQFVHPAVNLQVEKYIEQEEEKNTKWFILEAALLNQPYYRTILDEIWYIHVDETVREQRLKESRDYSTQKIQNMIKSQPSEEEFRNCADHVIENGGAFEGTKMQIDRILKKQQENTNETM